MQPLDIVDITLLALIEGVAEVLPVDSAGHGLLLSWLVHWRAGSIGVAIHLGAALGLLAFLWRDVAAIGQGLWRLRRGRVEPGSRLFGKIILTAAPWIAATLLLDPRPPGLEDMALIGALTIACALLMGLADRLCMTVKRIDHMSPLGALILGLSQLLALAPGVGRAAAALTTSRILGFERPAAFRFVLLASVPVLLAATIRDGLGYLVQGVLPAGTDLAAGLASFLLVVAAAALSTAWTSRHGLLPFVLYRLVIGAVLVGLSFL